jgi:hypothetical protein
MLARVVVHPKLPPPLSGSRQAMQRDRDRTQINVHFDTNIGMRKGWRKTNPELASAGRTHPARRLCSGLMNDGAMALREKICFLSSRLLVGCMCVDGLSCPEHEHICEASCLAAGSYIKGETL